MLSPVGKYGKSRQLAKKCRKFKKLPKSRQWYLLGGDVFRNYFVMYYYGKHELVDKSACAVQRADLKLCLLLSDCVKKLKKTPRQCLLEPEGMVPEDCFALRNAFFECKRSLIDMRARFRGIKS